MVGDEEKVL